MFEIIEKKALASEIVSLIVEAPLIAAKAEPGHFVVVRVSETGERIPLTIADYNRDRETIELIIQAVGYSTIQLSKLEEGDQLLDVLGPLGEPVEIEKLGRVVCVAGGIGVAPIYPKAKELKEAGNEIISIIGAQTEEKLIMQDRMESISEELYLATDDGSIGHEGFVTEVLESVLEENEVDEVIAIGPVVMMKAACEVTADYGIDTVVSLNPIMVDGTGMCGGCRVTVGGENRFACVDGPAFDGHKVDFVELMRRQDHYHPQEEKAMHRCKLEEEVGRDG
ncbi:sulfide/dihydroorotate dehydrogenase-like FAD/NAD-binding protein [Acetohalobium arabaticum]|uniref:Sulfide dehydrogenase (Flavoprotein) subunit SudB n=1 Tax=Acetohalobium arabaticum (strain ATCC 49924 / DSM 5501 / Z-7288) TaxID=574087 RepID=D9QSS5_ACEAZ|nr:sulfide/dihydroorotate dehydrogenase-like FAD/NAD-binding protein [Acetohalobium arabaticum]ADL11613.1 sulfide dehydrogenase (flavoprotein) subunit SudB [Acetohalobium arabaticum DSM 5501]